MIDIKAVFDKIQDHCVAIYYGGSRVDPIINNPHDYDYICFAKTGQPNFLRKKLRDEKLPVMASCIKSKRLIQKSLITNDFSQIRIYPYTHITWFSYLDPLMICVAGEDICPKTDVIHAYRAEFIQCLKEKAIDICEGRILNEKRWYHILRGIYILLNNSYDVTPEQRIEINMLHDLPPGYKQIIDKTLELLKTLK